MNQKERLVFNGRLGKNPDLLYTEKDQRPVCLLSVATQNFDEPKPVWHKVVVWGKQAELCKLYLKKGSEVFVKGQQVLRQYKNKNGEEKSFTEVQVDTLGFTLV